MVFAILRHSVLSDYTGTATYEYEEINDQKASIGNNFFTLWKLRT